MENEKIISVIIPVYNTGDYLNRCLDSIINNTYKNLQIICVDDGSTDENTCDILRRYKEKDDRIIVHKQKNQGVSAARNTGLSLAIGEYIAFVDSDDTIHKKYFEILLKEALKNNSDVVAVHSGRNIVSDLNCEFCRISVLDAINNKNFKSVWGKLFLSEKLNGHKFNTALSIGEDAFYIWNFLLDTSNIVISFTEAKLYCYTDRPKETLIKSFVHNAPSDFSLGCTNKPQ